MNCSRFAVPFACSLAFLTSSGGASAEPTRRLVEERSSAVATAGWITMGGGALLVSGSVVMFALAQHKQSEDSFGSSSEPLGPRNRTIERYHVSGQVLRFTGAGAFATGLSLVLFGPKEHKAQVLVGAGTLQLRACF